MSGTRRRNVAVWQLSRRQLIKGAVAVGSGLFAGGNSLLGAEHAGDEKRPGLHYRFPNGFLWGAGTSGLQHEGSPLADGAAPSMMYTWAHTPGKVPENGTFDITADFYRRYRSDIRLMRDMNLRAYNLEVYWPRIVPEGTGRVNESGLDFYDRLVNELLAADIVPLCNLYVFDHPATLQDRGGWLSRDMAQWFADYASILFDRLGDRIPYWTTICEIQIINHISYAAGVFPPEKRDLSASLRANHHLLLGQGLAVQAFRASGAQGEIGNQHGMKPARAATSSEEDVEAARRVQAYFNLLATDPQLRGEYPAGLVEWYGETWPHDAVMDGDLEIISTPIDFFGMDYYNDFIVRHDPLNATIEPYGANLLLEAEAVRAAASGTGIYDALLWIRDRYGNIPIHLLEIGIPLEDTVDNGIVHDPVRIAYFQDLLTGAHRAIGEGVDLRSCFIWSFLDGWEFNAGLSSRYGLVHVDYETGRRTVKDSGHWYSDVIAANGIAVV